MYTSILKSFISRLGFVSEKVNLHHSNFEINILNNFEEQNQIKGTISINSPSQETEIILFETKLSKSDDMLIFKTKYQSEGKLHEEVDTFAITNEVQRGYPSSKTKIIIHVVNGKVHQAYRVGKKYKFENGINENLTKFNMENKDVKNMLSNAYGNNKKR